MIQLLLKLLIVLLLYLAQRFTLIAQGEVTPYEVSASQSVNARACPQLNCAVVATFQPGDIVYVLEQVSGDSVFGSAQWYRINEGGDAYIHEALLQLAALSETEIEATAGLNTLMDTSLWNEYNGDSVRLRTPRGWLDTRELLDDEAYMEHLAAMTGMDSREMAEIALDYIENEFMDLHMTDINGGGWLEIWHEDIGDIPISISYMETYLRLQAEANGGELVSEEIVAMPEGEAARVHVRYAGHNGSTDDTDVINYVFVTRSRVYYLSFYSASVSYDWYGETFDAIALSFRAGKANA